MLMTLDRNTPTLWPICCRASLHRFTSWLFRHVRPKAGLADQLPADVTDDDIARWLERAKPAVRVAADGPIPLFPPLPPAQPFPVNALGSVLSRAAAAIARKVQVPEAIAAQSVFAA